MARRLARSGAAAMLAGLLATSAARSQTTGSIQGVVRDAAGGSLRSADVLVSSTSLQGARTVKTDREGRFWLPALTPGTYAVTVALAGFRPATKSLTVSLDAKATVDFALEPAVEESVSVSGESPPIDLTSTTGGTNYTSSIIGKLPVARNYADIVRSNPAVDTDRADPGGRGLALTIYGATSAENQWIIDGVNTTGVFKGQQGKSINNEFVAEVEVKTDGYGAEYGRALGGVINVITKSGGNTFHGDAFVYYDSDGTAAKQAFTAEDSAVATMRLADYSRSDFGADLGGYLVKDGLWFFAAYNRVSFAGNVSRLDSTPYVSRGDRFPLDATDNLYSGKLTWNVATSTTIIGTVFADPSTNFGAAGADPREGAAGLVATPIVNRDPSTWSSSRWFGGTDYSLRATQLLGTRALITLQAAHHRDQNSLTAANQGRIEDWTCAGGTPEIPCNPPPGPTYATGGFGWIDGDLGNNQSTRWQYRGDVSVYAGNHELKAGGEYLDGRSTMTYACTGGQCVERHNEAGQTYYLHTFSARSGEDLTPLPNGLFRASVRDVGAYVQDSWKALPGLTVNLGLRWDKEYLENYQGVTVLQPANEWQPRLGVVWDPGNDGRTRVYASAGRFYYSFPNSATSWWFGNVTGAYTCNFDPVDTTPNPNVPGCPFDQGRFVWFGGGPWTTAVDQGIKGTSQDELTVGVERLLDPSFTVALKGAYRKLGSAMEDRCDFVSPDGTTYCAIINPGSGGRFARGDAPVCDGFDDPVCSDTGPASPPSRRTYRGIELLARKSIGTSLWLQASYVYSSLEGNYDGAVNQAQLQAHPGNNSDFDFPALWHDTYGRLFLDRPNRFRFDGYWVTPLQVAVGLQAFAESGAPVDRIGYFCCGQSEIYLVPRGSAGRLPTLWEANLTLSYPIAVGPATVTLQAYVYNLFNNQIATSVDDRWTVGPPDGYSIYDPNQPSNNPEYGKVTSRQAPRFFRAAVRVSF